VQELWDGVLAFLLEDLELDGIRPPSIATRDIAAAVRTDTRLPCG
jgi:hypothetical protein